MEKALLSYLLFTFVLLSSCQSRNLQSTESVKEIAVNEEQFVSPIIPNNTQLDTVKSHHLPERFKRCEKYQATIDKTVEKYWPKTFNQPKRLTAQLYQESLCKPNAESQAGAQGIGQIMSGTWKELSSAFGESFKPQNAEKNIQYSGFYQARQMKQFKRRGRTDEETWPLGLAAYNSGLGSVLKAQKACDNARLWEDIAPCQHLITGDKNAKETLTYVIRTNRWYKEMKDYSND